MGNFKLIKTAAALALGASVVTSAVATTDASAASKYKIKSGKLVYAKSGKVVKGYVTYKSTVYKNGKKLTGLKGKTYYKAGKKATGTYKGAYYVKGVKKVTTGTYNKAYYVKGVKKVTTGIYNKKYYKYGKVATGTYKGAYYVKGIKKVTTGTYNGAYYVKGKKVVSTGLYADKLYVDGKLNKGYKLYKEDLYKDAVLNTELALFEGKLYDGAKQNDKLVIFDGKLYDGVKVNEGIKEFDGKWYNDAELANGTFTIEGKEVAIEKGIEVGAKVASVEAVSATQIKVTFNKSVDAKTVNDENGDIIAANIKFTKLHTTSEAVVATAAVVEGKTVTYTVDKAPVGEYTVEIDKLKTTGKEDIARFAKVVSFEADTKAPTLTGVKQVNANVSTVKFSESLKTEGTVTYTTVDGKVVTDVSKGSLKSNGTEVDFDLTNAKVDGAALKEGQEVVVKFVGAQDQAGNLLEPNPSTITIKKVEADKAAPTVTSVAQTGAKEITVKFDKAVKELTTADKSKFTLSGSPNAATAVKKVSDTEYVITFTNVLDGELTFAVAKEAIQNVDGTSAIVDFSQTVKFVKDAATAKIAKSEVVVENGVNYLELTFDKNVEISTTTSSETSLTLEGTKVTNNFETVVVGPKTVKSDANTEDSKVNYKSADDKKVIRVKLADILTTPEVGETFNLDLTVANLKTEADVAVNATSKVSFKYAKDADAVNEKVLAAPTVAQVEDKPGYVTVTFNEAVDGASATNIANYTIAGAVIESAQLAPFSAGTQVVTLKLKDDSNTFTGVRNITVENVKALGSTKTMEVYKVNNVSITENVSSKVVSSKLVDDKTIEINFDSAVEAPATTAFVVKAGLNVLQFASTTPVELSTDGKTVTLKLENALTSADLQAGVTISEGTTSIVDDAKNVTKFGTLNIK